VDRLFSELGGTVTDESWLQVPTPTVASASSSRLTSAIERIQGQQSESTHPDYSGER
jgi:hypothetical protein